MESFRLSEFYRTVTSWPRNEADLSAVAERVQRLLEVPVALIWIPEFGIRSAGVDGVLDPSQDGISKLVQTQINSLPESVASQVTHLKKIQLSKGSAVIPDGSKVTQLSVALLNGEVRADNPSRDGDRARKNFGWLIVGSDKAINGKSELLMLTASQHLTMLAIQAHFENALAMRDQFLSIASHELKTPLTSIYGIVQLQERMLRPKPGEQVTPEQEKQRSFFKIVIRQIKRLNELIDGLLDVSRIQNGRFVVEPSESDVVSLARETVASRLVVIAQEAGVKVQLDVPSSLSAWVDPVRFEEVVTNLGMNAIRFSPEGGTVWIKLRTEGDQVVLSVRDQGPAIPESDRNRIFQPFERAQRTSRLGGLGLGLFISRQIAQLHGGSVALVESVPSRGNLFEARFPLKSVRRMSA